MATKQDRPRVPNIKFRVLIIGRANAGKTSILQRVCDTTESPEIFSVDPSGTRHPVVRPRSGKHFPSHGLARFNWTLQQRLCMLIFLVTADRDDIACSVGYITSTTNTSSRATMVMFSMTREVLKQAV